jgi:hypothetical protein
MSDLSSAEKSGAPLEVAVSMKKVAVASVIGTTVEWYDLFVFATASALVFNKVFFPDFVPLIGTLLAFRTFASAYLARIVGAALLQAFEKDRLGPAHALFAVPQQMNVHIGNPFVRRQAPEQSGVDVSRHHVLGQTTDTEAGDHQSPDFFPALECLAHYRLRHA